MVRGGSSTGGTTRRWGVSKRKVDSSRFGLSAMKRMGDDDSSTGGGGISKSKVCRCCFIRFILLKCWFSVMKNRWYISLSIVPYMCGNGVVYVWWNFSDGWYLVLTWMFVVFCFIKYHKISLYGMEKNKIKIKIKCCNIR